MRVLGRVWEPASRGGTAFCERGQRSRQSRPREGAPGAGACASDERPPSADVIGRRDCGLVGCKIEPAVACVCELRRWRIDSVQQTHSNSRVQGVHGGFH
jgi:hypothetical protein